MQGTISIKLEDGASWTGTITVTDTSEVVGTTKLHDLSAEKPVLASQDVDFSLPLRPFMNDYSDGLSGSKRFALLIAHFAHGELDVAVDRTEVIEAWNKMTGLLGGKFNGAHESRAKDSGYIYVPTAGKFALLKKWTQVLK